MAHTVIWSTRAVADLESIASFIAQDSETYSRSTVRTILQKARSLATFPRIGRVVPELDDEDVREIFAYSYRIIYRLHSERVEIVAIVHGRRSLEIALHP